MEKLFLAIYGNEVDALDSFLIAFVSIVLVFVILLLIVLIIVGMQKIFFSKNKEEKNEELHETVSTNKQEQVKSTEITDEDMMVAALIATIDYSNETKKDVKLVSIKQIG